VSNTFNAIFVIGILAVFVYFLFIHPELKERKRIREGKPDFLDEIFNIATKHHEEPLKTKERILACPQGIITYRVADTHTMIGAIMGIAKCEAIDQKIREMLVAHPTCRIADYENELGIKVIRQEGGQTSRRIIDV
jgi:hypothetical protein